MSYLSAPATKMLAVRCAVCCRALLDATSVEIGMGPDCRAQYLTGAVSDEARTKANVLVHQIAILQRGPEVLQACKELRELGFTVLSDRILDRLAKVVLEEMDGGARLKVFTPYLVRFSNAMGAIPGRAWHPTAKAWSVKNDIASKRALHQILVAHFPGLLAKGPRGPFVLQPNAKQVNA
jgi:hypothetical protein